MRYTLTKLDHQSISAILCAIIFIITALLNKHEGAKKFEPLPDLASPKIQNAPIPEITDYTPIEVKDLTSILFALEKYKSVNHHYPVSSNYGNGWDAIHSLYGESREDWIEGLAPHYINKLPRDPRLSEEGMMQYLYKSNGAKFKLISHVTDKKSMKLVQLHYPNLIDPIRSSYSFGYWSTNSISW